MNLLWIVVLIQTIFFIVQNEHLFVFMFIGLSLCINAFSKNDLVYLGLPIIIVFGIYFYIRDYKLKKEGFTTRIVNNAIERSNKILHIVKKKFNEIKNTAKNAAGENDDYDQPEDVDYSYDAPDLDIPGDVKIPPDMEPLEEPPPEVQPTKAQQEADETKINGEEYGLDSL